MAYDIPPWDSEVHGPLQPLQVVTKGEAPYSPQKVVLFDLEEVTGMVQHPFLHGYHDMPLLAFDVNGVSTNIGNQVGVSDADRLKGRVLRQINKGTSQDPEWEWVVSDIVPGRDFDPPNLVDVNVVNLEDSAWPTNTAGVETAIATAIANNELTAFTRTVGDVIVFTKGSDAGDTRKEARAFMLVSGTSAGNSVWQELYVDNKVIGAIFPDPEDSEGDHRTGPWIDLRDFVTRGEIFEPEEQLWKPINTTPDLTSDATGGTGTFDNKIFFTGHGAAISSQPNIVRDMIQSGSYGPKLLIRSGTGSVADIRVYRSTTSNESTVTPTDWLDFGYLGYNNANVWGFESRVDDIPCRDYLKNTYYGLEYRKGVSSGNRVVTFNATDYKLEYSLSEITQPTNTLRAYLQLVNNLFEVQTCFNGNSHNGVELNSSNFNVSIVDNQQLLVAQDKVNLNPTNVVNVYSPFLQLPKTAAADVTVKLSACLSSLGLSAPPEGLMYVCPDSTYGSTLKIYLNGDWRTVVVQ